MFSAEERGFANAHSKFWDDLACALVSTNTDILCGDFNMALWRVVPELSSRGLRITVLAFYPLGVHPRWRGNNHRVPR